MKNLLLPYAYDSTGNLVHIDNARKEDTYKCPECGKVLSLNISRIPEGQKYHRRNHFSHPKGSPDNKCTESFLHKLFKERAANCIREKITNGNEFIFAWQCNECSEYHQGNMLKKARIVCLEYDLGICRPDVALLDADGKVVIAIEVIVTHKPEPETIAYYNAHKIACLQINVSDFSDCENVEDKLMHPDSVNLCPVPICKICGQRMHMAKMTIVNANCWKCKEEMKIAMIVQNTNHFWRIYEPTDFTKEEIELANSHGANIQIKYSIQAKESYYANVCKRCNAFIGKLRVRDYYNYPHIKEIELFKCHKCIELKTFTKKETERKQGNEIDERIMNAGIKTCPECQCELVFKKGKNGYFYECGNYPNCKYTENIILGD